MAKHIILTYKDKDYTLEFTRDSVRAMETGGFDISRIDSAPITMIPRFIAGAFKANHPQLKKDKIEEIYSQVSDKSKFIECLAEMYNETVESLTSDNEDSEGNSEWKASW